MTVALVTMLLFLIRLACQTEDHVSRAHIPHAQFLLPDKPHRLLTLEAVCPHHLLTCDDHQVFEATQSVITSNMHEIVTLQLGQRANYLATHFWNLQVV